MKPGSNNINNVANGSGMDESGEARAGRCPDLALERLF